MDVENAGQLVRIVTIGDSSVGKTSFINHLTNVGFDANEPATIGANFVVYVVETELGRMELQIWDTAGQERFKSLGPIYYRNSAAAIVVFDLTKMESFQALNDWIKSFLDITGPKAIIMVIGNKCDLVDDNRSETAQKWAESCGYLYFNTSALTGYGIKTAMQALAAKLSEKLSDDSDVASAKLSVNKNKNGKCCK